jgi:hypothetical protein
MATNFFFQNFEASNEQNLYEDLIIESIRIYGENMFYIPRELKNYDKLLGEDDSSEYNRAIMVELYIKSVDGFSGNGNFLSKFGLQIRDQVIFSIARRTFDQEVTSLTTQTRPNEGDLIFFPLNKKCFQIKYVNNFEMFYQFGALQTWELTCELFEYSNEILNTGIEEIDILQKKFSLNILDYAFEDENGDYLVDENGDYLVTEKYNYDAINPTALNEVIQTGSENFGIGSDDFVDFSEINPFSEGSV